MDKVSPALQFGMDKVERRSWESSSSPLAYHQSSERTLAAAMEQGTSRSKRAAAADQTLSYSVMTNVDEGGMRDRSRESTAEPLSPANLQIMQDTDDLCKQEHEEHSSDYSCSGGGGGSCSGSCGGGGGGLGLIGDDSAAVLDVAEPVRSKKRYGHIVATTSTTTEEENYQGGPMMNLAPPTAPPTAPSPTPSSSGGGGGGGNGESSESRNAPQPIKFGTYLQPGLQDKNLIISLEGSELWHQFFQAGTEMIITKSGRRMFPGIVISVGGMDPDLKYSMALEFNPMDNARYKYINTKWVNIGKAEAHCEELLKYVHPESPATGKHWMSSKVSFKKVKVTNNKNHKKGLVVSLNSMHKYQPRVVISRFYSKRNQEPIFTHDLVECTFIGVTAYQNDQVTQLKIDHNPFAKAFRESVSDNEMYNYGMMASWPSPLLSPAYAGSAASFSAEAGQALPLLSPSCIPPAGGPSPLPQFNSVFCNWESPPYSPSVSATYRSPFPNPAALGTLPSPTLLQDHRQLLSSRLMSQESPPISPHIYQPPSGAAGASGGGGGGSGFSQQQASAHQLLAPSTTATTAILAAQQYSNLIQQQQQQLKSAMPTSAVLPDAWVPKTEYAASNSNSSSGSGSRGSGSGSSGAAGALTFDTSSGIGNPAAPLGYCCYPGLKTSAMLTQQLQQQQQQQQQGQSSNFSMPKTEQTRSPGDIQMDMQP